VAAETEFCLLGPLLVRHRGTEVSVPSGKQRSLLAALLLSAGRPVTVDELAEALWGASPPPSARASLHNYVMRLRKSLADAGLSRITTLPDGYLFSAGPGELDVDQFESALATAREAARNGSWADAAVSLRMALSLWRGQPLSGVPSDTLARREAPRLAEMRLQALEVRIDADLHLGRHADVIIELRQLAAAHPLRERLHALLMIALWRNGQQAAALAAFQAARRPGLSRRERRFS
jgi:DNA-binding SARP family transcriptional activator